jgi:hypothetical protein
MEWPMLQRCYFHLNYTDDLVVDTEGLAFADLQSAAVAAVQSIRELAADPPLLSFMRYKGALG